MDILKIIFLGVIQGLSEFLPISSSGHLVLLKHFFAFKTGDITLEIILHIGSLFAVLVYFRGDIFILATSVIRYKDKSCRTILNRKVVIYLLLATLVTGIFGILFQSSLEAFFDKPLLVCLMLFVTGFILLLSDKMHSKDLLCNNLGIKKSLLMGFVQFFAIIPGISRSGSTVAFGIFSGLKREEAARFSFLLSIPAILGALILKFEQIVSSDDIKIYLLGAFFAFVSGYLVISSLIKIIKKQKLRYFAYYCFILSSLSLIKLLWQ